MKYDNYEDYLASDKWAKIKQTYKDQPGYDQSCFLCYNTDHLNFHHWRYPKDWNNDSYKNIMLVCQECHSTIHNTRIEHDSHHYKESEMYKYLSHLIKELDVMKMAYFETLSEEF